MSEGERPGLSSSGLLRLEAAQKERRGEREKKRERKGEEGGERERKGKKKGKKMAFFSFFF
jgi:hypothetical protein